MQILLATALVVPALVLVAAVLVPPRRANLFGTLFRKLVTLVAAAQSIVAIGMAAAYVTGVTGNIDATLITIGDGYLAASVYYDGVSSLMLALVSFVGWVICRYSIRYLDGEPAQGQYFRWTGFTIGAVSLLVLSGNLLMFLGCWVMTSLGLHHLLLHYGHRPGAQRAAWTKFTVSRLGEAAVLAAIVLIYGHFGTVEFSELFRAIGSESGEFPAAVQIAGLLLVVGAVTKSAQFPFHTWMPLTMETPTPVSALMHAGIVNAGGYLIIRTSPIVSIAPWALSILAIFGAATACFAAAVMLTQTSVKKSLAYSTIGQMGFMMLQCGLGAFSAAMLHILAHSLYKAHAFLSSGNAASRYERIAIRGPASCLDQAGCRSLVDACVSGDRFPAGRDRCR
jgi:NAD(P)H-quinone oxidoreductase subunit 5